jgi:nicotinate-nucleotide adenylyltransferase
MDRRRRIAVYGGTFDPVHFGHLAVARNVVELFEIHELLFVPAHQAPHKIEHEVTQPIHRYAMLALATQDDDRLRISSVEIDSAERRYTVETLNYLKARFGPAAELFFVMGADSWSEITTWRDWQNLMELTNHIVVTRPGYELNADRGDYVTNRIVDVRGWKPDQIDKVIANAAQPHVYISDAAEVDISATDIREAARSGNQEILRAMVPAAVADYVTKYELYKN